MIHLPHWAGGISRFRRLEGWGKMTCCIENPCISGADQAEARPEQIGAALAAIARRPFRASLHEPDLEFSGDVHAGGVASVSGTKPNLAL